MLDLIGGGPQGSLIGQLLYIIGSDDVAEEVNEEDKFKFVDDLSTLEVLNNKENLIEHDFFSKLCLRHCFWSILYGTKHI